MVSGYKVRVSERRGVMPDLQFYRKGNDAPRGQEQGLVAGRADLVVEVISPPSRRYDRVTKLRYYAELGVPEYWIVDPDAKTVEDLVLRDGGVRDRRIARRGRRVSAVDVRGARGAAREALGVSARRHA